MKHSILAAVLSFNSFAAPSITAVGARNAASYASSLAPNRGIAPGSRFVLVGKDLGPDDTLKQEAEPLATELGGVTVQVRIGDSVLEAAVLSAGKREIVALLPADAPVGSGTAVVSYNGETAETSILVQDRAVGLYASGSYGSGAAVAVNADGNPVALLTPANPGKTVHLRASGFGATTEGEFEVRVGGKIASNVAVTRQADAPGIDDIAFEIPAEEVDGCFVPVAVRAGEQWSNFVTMAVAAEGARCSSPTVSSEDLDRIASGEQKEVRVGSVSATRSAASFEGMEMITDSIGGTFQKVKFEAFANGSAFQGDFSYGSCFVPNFNDIQPADSPYEPQLDFQALNTGALTLTGPKGTKELGEAKGEFSAMLGQGFNIALPPGVPPPPSTLYLETGTYRLAALAGEHVGPFSVEFEHNPAVWSNSNTINGIARAEDLNLTWNGGGEQDIVVITGGGATGEGPEDFYNGSFVCVAKASAKQFTVPSYILQNLPVTPAERGFLALLSVSSPKFFQADGLDTASVSTMRMALIQTSYK